MIPTIATPADRLKAPAVNEIDRLKAPAEEITVLPNGLTLHVVAGGVAALTSMRLLLPGGVAEAPAPRLFGLTSRLIPEGSLDLPGDRLAEFLEDRGSTMATRLTNHHTELSITGLSSAFSSLMPLLAETILRPEFSPAAIDKVKRSVVTRFEIAMREVPYLASLRLKEMLYGVNNPYVPSREIDSLLTYSRDTILSAHNSWLCPSAMHLYIGGRLDNSMIDLTAKTFSNLSGTMETGLYNKVSFPTIETGSVCFTPVADAVQNSVSIGIPAIGRNHPDYIALYIAVTALGGYFGSRLTLNIREEKGLTYGISASMATFSDTGYIIIESDTDPANVNQLIAEVRAEIERLKDPGSFSPDEITRLRRHILSDLARITDTPFSRLMYIQTFITNGSSPTGFADLEAAARTLSPSSIAETADRYMDPDRIVISIAGARY